MERHLDPSYPQRVSSERTHHGQKQRLLQESKERTDQGLQSCEATKLCGGVPVGAMRPTHHGQHQSQASLAQACWYPGLHHWCL